MTQEGLYFGRCPPADGEESDCCCPPEIVRPHPEVEVLDDLRPDPASPVRIPQGTTAWRSHDQVVDVGDGPFGGVSHQAVTQFVQRVWRVRDRARPPAGIWLPQVGEAERDGWLEEYAGQGMDATRGFFRSGGG